MRWLNPPGGTTRLSSACRRPGWHTLPLRCPRRATAWSLLAASVASPRGAACVAWLSPGGRPCDWQPGHCGHEMWHASGTQSAQPHPALLPPRRTLLPRRAPLVRRPAVPYPSEESASATIPSTYRLNHTVAPGRSACSTRPNRARRPASCAPTCSPGPRRTNGPRPRRALPPYPHPLPLPSAITSYTTTSTTFSSSPPPPPPPTPPPPSVHLHLHLQHLHIHIHIHIHPRSCSSSTQRLTWAGTTAPHQARTADQLLQRLLHMVPASITYGNRRARPTNWPSPPASTLAYPRPMSVRASRRSRCGRRGRTRGR